MSQVAKYPRSDTSAVTDTKYVAVFQRKKELSDITFEVEGKKLHFWKFLLRLASPVFESMFTLDFKEKDSKVIPLPGKKVKDIDIFLQNIHPAYAWKHLEDDDTLEILMGLADEYQTDHISQKCLHYITKAVNDIQRKNWRFQHNKHQPALYSPLTHDVDRETQEPTFVFYSPLAHDVVDKETQERTFFFFSLCEQYQLPFREQLVSLLANIPLVDLEAQVQYRSLSEGSKSDILRARCRALERRCL